MMTCVHSFYCSWKGFQLYSVLQKPSNSTFGDFEKIAKNYPIPGLSMSKLNNQTRYSKEHFISCFIYIQIKFTISLKNYDTYVVTMFLLILQTKLI